MEPTINSKEKVYYSISLAVSILIYFLLVISLVGIVYILIGALIALVVHGLFIGNLRGNSVRVSERQFPEVFHIAISLAKKMNLDTVPTIYVVQAGGIFNAFATRFSRRNFVVIYSDVLELAYEQGEPALAFVISHELAHIKRKHLTNRFWLYPSMAIPFLGTAYSRACEYTCDSFAYHYQPDGAIPGILALAVGKKLYHKCDPYELGKQVEEESGFWIWLAEVFSTHPFLPKRLVALGALKEQMHFKSLLSAKDAV